MNELERQYTVTRADLAKNKAMTYGAWASPILFAALPALVFLTLFLTVGGVPFLFWSLISLVVGAILGLTVTGGILFYRSRWLARIKERIAVDGVKAHEVDWFKNELTAAERKSLKEIQAKDMLLADAFRDTLAVRLTATRILKSTKQELQLVSRRQNKLKYLKSENSTALQHDLKTDAANLEKIKREAEEMRVEAETRLQMIDAAFRRGASLADSELTLKKLQARTSELPLALESAKMEQEIRREFERELENEK